MTEAEILRIHLFDLLSPYLNHHCHVHLHSNSFRHHHPHHRIQAKVYEGPIALVGQGLLKWSSVWRGFLMLPIFASDLDNCHTILPLDKIDNHQTIWWPYICLTVLWYWSPCFDKLLSRRCDTIATAISVFNNNKSNPVSDLIWPGPEKPGFYISHFTLHP